MSNLRSFFLFFVRNEIGWSRRRKKEKRKCYFTCSKILSMNVYLTSQELCHIEVNNGLFAFHNWLGYICIHIYIVSNKEKIQMIDGIRIIDFNKRVERGEKKKNRHKWRLSNRKKTNDLFFLLGHSPFFCLLVPWHSMSKNLI